MTSRTLVLVAHALFAVPAFAGGPVELTAYGRMIGAQSVPPPGGAPGAVLNHIYSIGIDNHRRVQFAGAIGGDPNTATAVYSFFSPGVGQLEFAAPPQVGPPPAIGTRWTSFVSGFDPSSHGSSQLAIYASGVTNLVPHESFLLGGPGTLAERFRTGQAAPDLSGITIDSIRRRTSLESGVATGAGRFAFAANLSGAGTNVDNRTGLFGTDTNGDVRLIARAGAQAPGFAPGMKFTNVDRTPRMSSSGSVMFSDAVRPNTTVPATTYAIWRGSPGNLQLLVATGDASPIPGTNFLAMDTPSTNSRNDALFRAGVIPTGSSTGARFGLFYKGVGGDRAVAMTDEPLPGLGAVNGFGLPMLASNGTASFLATTSNGRSGLYKQSGSSPPVAVAFDGMASPEGSGGQIDRISGSYVMNDLGQIAFFASSGSNNYTLFAEDQLGALRRIAAVGDVISIAPNMSRTITSIHIDTFSFSDGRSGGAFNELGQLVFVAQYFDGQAVFVANVPSPGTACALLPFAGWACRRRRRAS